MFKFFQKSDIDDKIPENFAVKCKSCNHTSIKKILKDNYFICPNCNSNLPREARELIEQIVDIDSFNEMYKMRASVNPLSMDGYRLKQKQLKDTLDIDEAIVCGTCLFGGMRCGLAVMDTRYLMGSLGTKTGEKLTLLIEHCTRKKYPLVIFTASGGARMQEGILSLMQMAKVTNALKRHSNKGLFYMPILMNPTTGGVSASFAQIGDVIIAENDALICFAGPKVIEKTIKQQLPDGFQKSEFLLEKGFVDKIVLRKDQREFIIKMLKMHGVKNG